MKIKIILFASPPSKYKSFTNLLSTKVRSSLSLYVFSHFGAIITAVIFLSSFSFEFGTLGLGFGTCSAQNVGINITGATPNAKALLDIDAATMSPKGGLLIPRMTTTERNAISTKQKKADKPSQ